MIFWFSGTGNSEYIAKQLVGEQETLISMGKARRDDVYSYDLAEGESVGLVFPVYFYGLPDTVRVFIERLQLCNRPGYIYAVIDCGGSIAGAGNMLKKKLASKGMRLDAVHSVKMPDNYVLMYEVTTQSQEVPILEAAEQKVAKIKESISRKERVGLNTGVLNALKTAVLYPFYDRIRKTAKFHTNDQCVSCGVCAGRCPARAIELIDGTPTWIKPECDHCMSCIRCNAIEYGKRTAGKYRYKHPSLRKAKNDHADHGTHDHCAKNKMGKGEVCCR